MRTLNAAQLRRLILEAIKEEQEIKESDIKKAVVDCLKKEGGAAGIGLCIKTVKSLQKGRKKLPKKLKTNQQIERFILKMDNVVKHKYGDLILTTGLPKR
tara:strand:- start:723 stop:1022 length:300 start_codon:yes stop_codon:yes gene_type:complete